MQTKAERAGSLNNPIWRLLAWGGVALQVIALIFVLWAQKWNGAWVIALFLAISVAFLMMQDRLPSLISFLVVRAALINAGGWSWEWYQAFAWFDEFIHFFTSFAVMSAMACWHGSDTGPGRAARWCSGPPRWASGSVSSGRSWKACF